MDGFKILLRYEENKFIKSSILKSQFFYSILPLRCFEFSEIDKTQLDIIKSVFSYNMTYGHSSHDYRIYKLYKLCNHYRQTD